MVSARLIAQWSVPLLVAQFPFLIYLTPLFVVATFALFLSKRLREKIKKVFLNLFRKSYKRGRLLVPKNKITRLVFNIGFVVVWMFVFASILEFLEDLDIRLTVYEGTPQYYLILTLLSAGILFFTQFLWLPNGFRDITNTFSKIKKETKKRVKSILKYLSKSNISDAEELKKYAELRDNGIITEEEFKFKKKQLLDL